MSIHSAELGMSGSCDVVEFRRGANGIPLQGQEGSWQPYPVEYKRGMPKVCDADRLQLCAQAMCLETMLCCDIPEGALYYGQTRRRETVTFDDALRQRGQGYAGRDARAVPPQLHAQGQALRGMQRLFTEGTVFAKIDKKAQCGGISAK